MAHIRHSRRGLRWLQNILVIGLLLVAVVSGWRLLPHPPLKNWYPHSTAVLAADGSLLRLTLASDDQYRLWTPFGKFSPLLKRAVLLHEDQWFWWHPGFNPWGLVRGAFETYVLHHHPQGGSTLTMQLVRLLYGLDTRSPWGKFKQVLLALRMELSYSKKAIFTAYLNYAPYGGNVVGAATASLIYFRKPVSQLTLPEALTLAVLPQSPAQQLTQKTPNGDVLAAALTRHRNALYHLWCKHYPKAKRLKALFQLPLAVRTRSELPYGAPHAVDQLLAQLRHSGQPLPTQLVTTIDPALQRLVNSQLQHYVQRHNSHGIKNAAALLVDTRNMAIKALVGSADFFDAAIDGQVNGTAAERSPGSTLKPFIYARAFDQGVIIPASILRDVPTNFGAYSPENFDSHFDGPISAAQALRKSRNVPAVWVDSQLGDQDLYSLLRAAGINNLASRRHYGLSLVLGGGDITMQELARLYAMFPNAGLLKPLRLNQAAPEPHGKRLLSRAASFMVTDILEHNPRPQAISSAIQGAPVFWKTGTSWAFHDAWTAGGFGPYVLVVWIGNFDATPNPAFVGVRAAAPLFFRIYDAMNLVRPSLKNAPKAAPPPGVRRVTVCLSTGMLPSKWCPQTAQSWFIPGVSPITVGHVYRPQVIDDATGQPACPPYAGKQTHIQVYQYWPTQLARVFQHIGIPLARPPSRPACQAAGKPIGEPPHITAPARRRQYVLRAASTHPPTAAHNRIRLTASSDADVRHQYWFIDKSYIGQTRPGAALRWTPPAAGNYQLRVVDDHGRYAQQTLSVIWADKTAHNAKPHLQH